MPNPLSQKMQQEIEDLEREAEELKARQLHVDVIWASVKHLSQDDMKLLSLMIQEHLHGED